MRVSTVPRHRRICGSSEYCAKYSYSMVLRPGGTVSSVQFGLAPRVAEGAMRLRPFPGPDSHRSAQLYMNEVILGTACGVLFGPYGANVLKPRAWGDVNAVTLEVMRITLAIGLFTHGVELPQSYLAEHARGLLVMIVPTMAFGWIVVACTSRLLSAGPCRAHTCPNFISSLVVAACLTPTDPIISAAIVGMCFPPSRDPGLLWE